MDRLSEASSVTRPGPLQCAPPPPAFLEHAQPISAASPLLPLYLENPVLSRKEEQIVHKLYAFENTTVVQVK